MVPVAATLLGIAAMFDYVYGRYQYVSSSFVDYLTLLVIAGCVSFLVFLRLARGKSDWVGLVKKTSTYNTLLFTTALTLLVSGALLRVCNGVFDTGPGQDYRVKVVTLWCGKGCALKVTGVAPLPDVVTISSYLSDGLSIVGVQPGDRVLLSVGHGFLGRPWIKHVQVGY